MQAQLDTVQAIHDEFVELVPVLDERRIRLWCAARARAYNRVYGRGGVSILYHATGVSRPRIATGIRELEEGTTLSKAQIRVAGGGRKKNQCDHSSHCAAVRTSGRAVYAGRSGNAVAVGQQKHPAATSGT